MKFKTIFSVLLRPEHKAKVNKPAKSNVPVTLEGFIEIASQGVGESTATNYHTALRSFLLFNGGKDITLSAITADKMKQYEHWLKSRGISNNTISCYLRSLRAVYNKGIDKRKIRGIHPFKGVFTGDETTVKTSLRPSELKKLRELNLPERSFISFARDLFLFSFCAMGLPPIDLAHLCHSQIKGDTITYCRRKTGRQVSIKITKQMREIMEKYRTEDSVFVFPILEHYHYRSFLSLYNRALNSLGQKIRLKTRLSSYTSRHSWASLAYENNIDLPVISQALGHSNTRTTLLYISKIDNRMVDKANKRLLGEIFCSPLAKR